MNRQEATNILENLGWRVNTGPRYRRAVRDFQLGWNLGRKLVVDGIVGPKTSEALEISEQRRVDRKGTASANFSFVEFRCKCGGRFTSCRRIVVRRYLIRGLEKYRKMIDKPVGILSGYRCAGHNAHVGGARKSQHMYGKAIDPTKAHATVSKVKSLNHFRGIGYHGANGLVRHMDVRTPGSTSTPTTWRY